MLESVGLAVICSHLMLDLEQCAKCFFLLQNTLICQVERSPALGQPGWGAEATGEKVLPVGGCYRCNLALAVCHCPEDSFEKGLLSFSAALDWLGRQHIWEVVRAARGPLLL